MFPHVATYALRAALLPACSLPQSKPKMYIANITLEPMPHERVPPPLPFNHHLVLPRRLVALQLLRRPARAPMLELLLRNIDARVGNVLPLLLGLAPALQADFFSGVLRRRRPGQSKKKRGKGQKQNYSPQNSNTHACYSFSV